uniref:NADH-ubiquinone oxidoreductase chain 3 n=1 Tax=Fuelleborniella sp. FuspCA TaxID=2597024 RepID=A0A8K1ZFG3_9NEOP|nr:NADH dehydrogenase subunit 3 [Fuelleborniella sp. FuspCA]
MINMMLSFTIIIIIANIMMILSSIISKKSLQEREKNSPFECGFDQKSSSRSPFSLHFFLITIIFLIFDIEIALILPSIYMLTLSSPFNWIMLNFSFIMILIIGILHEWNQNMLQWSK